VLTAAPAQYTRVRAHTQIQMKAAKHEDRKDTAHTPARVSKTVETKLWGFGCVCVKTVNTQLWGVAHGWGRQTRNTRRAARVLSRRPRGVVSRVDRGVLPIRVRVALTVRAVSASSSCHGT
jgi:hypothetical protein